MIVRLAALVSIATYSVHAVAAFLFCPPFASLNRTSRAALAQLGEPLLLTALIEAGDLSAARNRSRVPPLVDTVDSYSGFLTVNKTAESHLFFWYFPPTGVSAKANASTPLILWLQGGPGCSSLYGLFAENGPYEATKDGLRRRVHSWTEHYHMLYIDQPVGVGFSFTRTDAYISTQTEVGEQLYEALTQFYKLFSELQRVDFYIAGESYAGKFVPAIGHRILRASRQQPQPAEAVRIPLKGLMIGNGYSDPENQLEYADNVHSLGLIDQHERDTLKRTEEKIRFLVQSEEWTLATQYQDRYYHELNEMMGTASIYDYSRDNFQGLDSTYEELMWRDRMREKIHVGNAEYEGLSRSVQVRFVDDNLQTVRPWIEELLAYYPIMFYSGQYDIMCPHWLTDNFLGKMRWKGAPHYGLARKQIWTLGDKAVGNYKAVGNLVYVMVRNAGHSVPADQPEVALKMVNMFVGNEFRNSSTAWENQCS